MAAKFIATSDQRERRDAAHELDVMLRLRHCRRLVQLYDVFETDTSTCLVLEMYARPTELGWLGSRVVSELDSGAEGPGFKSQPRRCRVTILGKLFTPIVPLFTDQRNWWQPS